jgi:hypothetical protein
MKSYQKMIERGLSARTVRYTHAVLRSAIRQALQGRLLLENPVDGVTIQKALLYSHIRHLFAYEPKRIPGFSRVAEVNYRCSSFFLTTTVSLTRTSVIRNPCSLMRSTSLLSTVISVSG